MPQNDLTCALSSGGLDFASAINSSHLSTLQLSSNPISAEFLSAFLSSVNSPHLSKLYLSTTGLTSASIPALVKWLGDPQRCHLTTFKCNGNQLGFLGVQSIVRTIEMNNFCLTTCEIFSNQVNEEDDDDGSDASFTRWLTNDTLLKMILHRNTTLTNGVQIDAVNLLKYARPALLHSKIEVDIRTLPVELTLYTLSFIAPVFLSPSQRIRIFDYASDRSTLPPLLPSLKLGMPTSIDSKGSRMRKDATQFLQDVRCLVYEKVDEDGVFVRGWP